MSPFDSPSVERAPRGEVSSTSSASSSSKSLTAGRSVTLQPVDVSHGYRSGDQTDASCGSSSVSSSPSPSPITTDEDFTEGLTLQAGASSVGTDLWRFTTTAKRPRAGSMTPKHEAPTSDPFSLDRGPGTPDFTVDRFAQIRGKRDAHYMRYQQDMSAHSSLRPVSDTSLLPSHMSSPSSSPEPYSRGHASASSRSALQALTYADLQQGCQAAASAMIAHIRSFTVAAKMPPLRPHLPALLFLMTAFVGSTLCILLALSTLPLHLPRHITELTLAEIRDMSLSLRAYSRSSPQAFLHTLAVLGAFFTWKQAFTVPGSIIMNVVFGAMYGTWMGTLYTSLLTAFGGMLCYLLMSPLGPLVSAMPGLNQALQKMQNALRGSIPMTGMNAPVASRTTQRLTRGRAFLHERTRSHVSQRQAGADTMTLQPSGSSQTRQNAARSKRLASNLWSYLLVLRLLPVVPYGLMNIACSVLRVPLLPYTVTLGLGSIPWNACTVQIGDLLVEVVSALPTATALSDAGSSLAAPNSTNVQSGLRAISDKIWNREMMLKLALMSLVSLAPMLLQRWLKRRNASVLTTDDDDDDDEAVAANNEGDEVDMLERQKALEDGTDAELESMSGVGSQDSDRAMRSWRASWQPSNIHHQSFALANHPSPDKRHSMQFAHAALSEHRRTPPIKRAVAQTVL